MGSEKHRQIEELINAECGNCAVCDCSNGSKSRRIVQINVIKSTGYAGAGALAQRSSLAACDDGDESPNASPVYEKGGQWAAEKPCSFCGVLVNPSIDDYSPDTTWKKAERRVMCRDCYLEKLDNETLDVIS
jgi:hypothetical protein